MKTHCLLSIALIFLGAFSLVPGKANAQNLQRQLKDQNLGDHWIYNDWESAKAAALKEKKPIFVLFR